MLKRFNELMKRHLSENIWIYFAIIFIFVLGVSLGALTVNNIDQDTKNEVNTYIQGFISISQDNGISSAGVLKQSIKFNFTYTLILYLLGLASFGVFITPVLTGFRGFCIGFTVAFLTESLGRGGYLLSVASVLPQNIIIVPAIFIISVCSANASLMKLRNRFSRKLNSTGNYTAAYTISILAVFALFLVGSLIEAYITPVFIRIVTAYIS